MNIDKNKFWLLLSTVLMEVLLIIFVLWLNPVVFGLLLASALINCFLGFRLYQASHQGKL